MHVTFNPSFNQIKDRNWPFSEFAIFVVRFLGPLHSELTLGTLCCFPFKVKAPEKLFPEKYPMQCKDGTAE